MEMIHFPLLSVAALMLKSYQDSLVQNILISAITKYQIQTKLLVGKLELEVAFPGHLAKNHFQ